MTTPKKTAKVELRATTDEVDKWKSMAATKDIPLSEFARQAIDGVPVRARYQAKRNVDPDLIRELARIGNNLNQIARACNRRDIIAQRLDVLVLLVLFSPF